MSVAEPAVYKNEFVKRHVGPTPSEVATMLSAIGCSSLEDLVAKAVPQLIQSSTEINFNKLSVDGEELETLTEAQTIAYLEDLAKQNTTNKSMLGLGYYLNHTPSPIKRLILENPAWYTAYTPYQAEISQGRLGMLIAYQTMVADLCGLDMSNASLLDEATAAAEAILILKRTCKDENKNLFLVDKDTHPQTIAVIITRAQPLDIEIKLCAEEDEFNDDNCFGALFSYPGSNGKVYDWSKTIETLQAKNVDSIVCTDLLALNLIKSPGKLGASIAVGSSQRFGMPMGVGGPHAAFIAFDKKYVRQCPGRLVGISKDTKERMAFRLALQTREQHIRRDKATSNICTAQTLPAIVAVAYAIYHGPKGLKKIATKVHQLASDLAKTLADNNLSLKHESFFDTLAVKHENSKSIQVELAKQGIDVRCDQEYLYFSLDETTTNADINKISQVLVKQEIRKAEPNSYLEKTLIKDDAVLQHDLFNQNNSEHEFMRFLRRQAAKDIALDRSMIPLGSCTMKLNAATQMHIITNSGWANQHPYNIAENLVGFNIMGEDLKHLLCELTGFAGVSLQPNSGAQGEYAGLLTIRNYFLANGEKRNICLIPQSAHGTNPASAVLAGMDVVSLLVDDQGAINIDDLKDKINTHKDKVAALMVTYPSTCGIYNENINEVCKIVHEAGAQVYMDGANLNALVAISKPAEFGADVMHINLHKTFCIPHGGGGPGMGPIVCNEHLVKHLPPDPVDKEFNANPGAVSAAACGSGNILAISWAYIRLMGPDGLRYATSIAILAANYMAKRLFKSFKSAFESSTNFYAHEFVMDLQEYKKSIKVTVEQFAKRLIDYGYHAPTIAFPVANSIMVEPTESESLYELDRFCEVCETILNEMKKIEKGEYPQDNNPLVNAPHVAQDLLTGKTNLSYSNEVAAYPLAWLINDKYWPPVSYIDQVFGDRNLRCILDHNENLN